MDKMAGRLDGRCVFSVSPSGYCQPDLGIPGFAHLPGHVLCRTRISVVCIEDILREFVRYEIGFSMAA